MTRLLSVRTGAIGVSGACGSTLRRLVRMKFSLTPFMED